MNPNTKFKHNNVVFSTVGLKFDDQTPANNRAKVRTGSICNCNCEFCYNKNHLRDNDETFESIKEQIDIYYEFGIREFDLSGGEPSILKEFFDILDYCVSKPGCTVSCLSNGYKFANFDFIKKAQDHGLNEILFSLHGSNPETHDQIVGRKGAFKKLLQAIANAQKLGFRVRINCTVYDKNYHLLDTEYANLINNINPFEVNFILLNYFSDNKDFRPLTIDIICDAIKRCIDKIQKIKLINVRYVPFCYMQGYERYQTNYYQLLFDIYDWNLPSYVVDRWKLHKMNPTQRLKLGYDCARKMRVQSFVKPDKCKKCKYYFICDGMKDDIKHLNDVYPVPGDKITDINYFRKSFFDV